MNLDTNTIYLLIILAQFAVIVFLAFRVNGNVPPEFVKMVFTFAERAAASTPSQADDEFIEQLRVLLGDTPAKDEDFIHEAVAQKKA